MVRGAVAHSREREKSRWPARSARAGRNPGCRRLALDLVNALTVLAFAGFNRQAHLLAYRAGQESADTVGLPSGGLHEFGQSGALGFLFVVFWQNNFEG